MIKSDILSEFALVYKHYYFTTLINFLQLNRMQIVIILTIFNWKFRIIRIK